MRRPSPAALAIIFATFAVLTTFSSLIGVTEAEARLLWIVRDPERVEPASPTDSARRAVRNLQTMLDRAATTDLPVAVPLDVWTMAAGGSAFAARLPVVLLACLIAALALRRLPRTAVFAVPLALALLAMGGILAASENPPAEPEIRAYLDERHPAEPVVTGFQPHSTWGYYQAQYDLRRGVAVDLGWRAFADDEIARVIGNLGDLPVWLVGANSAIERAVLETGRVPAWPTGVYFQPIRRYDFPTATVTNGN